MDERITTEELAKAVELAEKATQGPWQHYDGYAQYRTHTHAILDSEGKENIVSWPGFDGLDLPLKQIAMNAAYIAFMSPDRTLRLLSALEESERKGKELCCLAGAMMLACRQLESLQKEHTTTPYDTDGESNDCICPACKIALPDFSHEAIKKLVAESNAAASALSEAQAEVEKWRQLDMCSVCGGQPLVSGRPCICEGKGTADAERVGLRKYVFELEEAQAERERANIEREGCKLVAHYTGDGWALMVEDDKGEVLGYLDWPKAWPDVMPTERLRRFGFEIV